MTDETLRIGQRVRVQEPGRRAHHGTIMYADAGWYDVKLDEVPGRPSEPDWGIFYGGHIEPLDRWTRR